MGYGLRRTSSLTCECALTALVISLLTLFVMPQTVLDGVWRDLLEDLKAVQGCEFDFTFSAALGA